MNWRKSSFSGAGNGACVEVAWRKSSFSNGTDHGACVEVAWPAPRVAVRDSKHPAGPTLSFPRPGWSTFLRTH